MTESTRQASSRQAGAADPADSFGAFAPGALTRAVLGVTRKVPETWAGHRLALALRKLAIRSLKGAPVDVEALGARMRLYPYRNVCDKKVLFTPQFFDPQERAILGRHVEEARSASRGFRFIDIGANIGAYSVYVAALAGPEARILAVEPQPDIFERLTFNIRQCPWPTVKAIACAVADKSGELTLFLDPDNSGESSLKVLASSSAQNIRVAAVPLLQLLAEEGFDRVDAMKLDVEGAEDIILEPFLRNAPDDLLPRLLIMEDGSDRWQIDLPALVTQRGYRQVLRTRLNFVFERDRG
ncbi:FkbM family methyltransferase [Camelimonas fluminis]|uniref:FkbM family methyltransferase n=1 Tax=Camelimonas fluminis TaxID=1576911 RepID=A0ABV7UFI7_9HYPH|nr:FkbM family methyltransferase [Camelimonas fluminis]